MVIFNTDYYKCICFTQNGEKLMERLVPAIGEDYESADFIVIYSLDGWVSKAFNNGKVLIFIGAAGIAVRAIAKYIKDKTTDPAVIVIDEEGKYVIPILSGHLGGAVREAEKIAKALGAEAVITTATDVRGEFAVDVFAVDNDMAISDMGLAKNYTAELLRCGSGFYSIDSNYLDDIDVLGMPDNVKETTLSEGFLISPGKVSGEILQLIPKCIVVGIGCKKGTPMEKLEEFFLDCLDRCEIDLRSVKAMVTIDIKRNEAGLKELSDKLNIPFITYGAELLSSVQGEFSSSTFVKSVTGVDNVCERSVMAHGCRRLIMRKAVESGMTCAIGICRTRIIYK